MLGIAFQIRTQIATARLRFAASKNTRPFDAFFTRATSPLAQIRCRQTGVVDTTQCLAALVFFYTRNPLKRRARWEAMDLNRGQKQQTPQNQWPMKYSMLRIHNQTNPPSTRGQAMFGMLLRIHAPNKIYNSRPCGPFALWDSSLSQRQKRPRCKTPRIRSPTQQRTAYSISFWRGLIRYPPLSVTAKM